MFANAGGLKDTATRSRRGSRQLGGISLTLEEANPLSELDRLEERHIFDKIPTLL